MSVDRYTVASTSPAAHGPPGADAYECTEGTFARIACVAMLSCGGEGSGMQQGPGW